jgi:hypothetical protein
MTKFPILFLIVISFFSLILFFTITISIFSNTTAAYAHLYSNNITQVWTDKLNNIKIQFSYLPEKPTADDIIQLQFSIQNFQTGSHLKDIIAKVTVTNEPLYRFDNITVRFNKELIEKMELSIHEPCIGNTIFGDRSMSLLVACLTGSSLANIPAPL